MTRRVPSNTNGRSVVVVGLLAAACGSSSGGGVGTTGAPGVTAGSSPTTVGSAEPSPECAAYDGTAQLVLHQLNDRCEFNDTDDQSDVKAAYDAFGSQVAFGNRVLWANVVDTLSLTLSWPPGCRRSHSC